MSLCKIEVSKYPTHEYAQVIDENDITFWVCRLLWYRNFEYPLKNELFGFSKNQLICLLFVCTFYFFRGKCQVDILNYIVNIKTNYFSLFILFKNVCCIH